jgi:hypothetical protein
MTKNIDKYTDNSWKIKATNRTKEIHALKKRVKEILKSRELWKRKYMEKKDTPMNITEKSSILQEDIRPKGYHYPSMLILFCIQMLSYSGVSLRSCKHFIFQLFFMFEIRFSVPSHTTIRMWSCKMGYYNYRQVTSNDDSRWAIIVDESVTLGENKILMVLGLCLDAYSFENPLQSSDVKLFHFEVKPKWGADEIKEILINIKQENNIRYVVSDKGDNLIKSYKESSIEHIPDCTHVFANALEHYFKKNSIADEYLSFTGKLRQKWNMGKKTIYMPPSQRKKSRFHNLSKLIKWGNDILDNWESLPEEIKAELEWFTDENRDTYYELKTLDRLISFIIGLLKKNGFNATIESQIDKYLENIKGLSKYGNAFISEIRIYIDTLRSYLCKENNILCCSDIIESIFGKLKYKVNNNSEFGITEFTFALASIGNNNSKEKILEAMENTKESDIKDWRKKNISMSLYQKKKIVFPTKDGEKNNSN